MVKSDKNNKIIHGFSLAFGELFLKSIRVREILIQRLINNLSFFLEKEGVSFKILNLRTRLFLQTDNKKAASVLKRTFGVVWFAPSFFFKNVPLEDVCWFVKANYQNWIKEKETFALRIKKDNDTDEKTEDIICQIAKQIDRKVDLDNPSKEIFVERRKIGWFLYLKKQKASGGLPIASQGRVLVLMSGGIDSPVAAHQIAKRGAKNVWLHFHSFPLVSSKSIEKTKALAKIFLNFQPRLKVYFIPFGDVQVKIKGVIEPKFRILLYRRAMLKIAQKIAEKENCRALVTGESLGQVSSQTLPNMEITEEAVKIPVLRPLISWDKAEIMDLAKKINTYETSIEPQEDCCTLFTPKHASAKGNLSHIKEAEKELKLAPLLNQAIKKAETKIF